MDALPTLFLSHGSPMHALDAGWVGEAWRTLAARLDRPRAILIASAHWETALPTFTASIRPPTIHDFGGFPPALYQLRYPAPGEPALAAQACALLRGAGLQAGVDTERGIDHGAWVPLLHMYPDAGVPVVQLSVQSHLPALHSLDVGRALAPLARDGVLIVGSGHMTHNLRDWFGTARAHGMQPTRTAPAAYVAQFSDWVEAALQRGDDTLGRWLEDAPHARRAHPSAEHFLPMPIAFGAAGHAPGVERIDLGTDSDVLAMDAYLFTPRS